MLKYTFGDKTCIPPEQLLDATLQARPTHPQFFANPIYLRRATSYTNPVGPATGKGWCLLTSKALQELLDDDGIGPHVFSIEHSLSVAGKDELQSFTLRDAYILQTVCVTPRKVGNENQVYLVEFVDVRHFLNTLTFINKSYNVRLPLPYADTWDASDENEFYKETVDDTDPWTWQTLVDDLVSECGSLLDATLTFSSTPPHKPENLLLVGVNPWKALHDVLAQVGYTTSFNPAANTFSLCNLTSSDGRVHANSPRATPRLVGHSLPVNSTIQASAWIPEKFQVCFFRKEENMGAEPDIGRGLVSPTNDGEKCWITRSCYTKEITTTSIVASVTPIAGTVGTIWSDRPAIYKPDGTVENQTDLDSHAEDLVELHTKTRLYSGQSSYLCYSGIPSSAPTAVNFSITAGVDYKAMTVRNYGDAAGLLTEYIGFPGLPLSPPSIPIPQYTFQQTGWVKEAEAWQLGMVNSQGVGANYLPPNYHAKIYPTLPRSTVWVRLVEEDEDEEIDSAVYKGQEITSDADGVFTGRIVRFEGLDDPQSIEDPDSASDEIMEKCYVAFPDTYGLASIRASVKGIHKMLVLGRINGYYKSGDVVRPLILAYWPVSFAMGELREQLDDGASADAVITANGLTTADTSGQYGTVTDTILPADTHLPDSSEILVSGWFGTDGFWHVVGGPCSTPD